MSYNVGVAEFERRGTVYRAWLIIDRSKQAIADPGRWGHLAKTFEHWPDAQWDGMAASRGELK
jgi:hypothetical protein